MSGRNESNGNEALSNSGSGSGAASSHELLCAHVLGELEGTDRERIERELAASAELRAERARIEATIGLVRGAFGGAESLPPGFLGRVEELAGPPRSARPRFARNWMRAAAGFALFAGAAVIVQEATKRGGAERELELVARGDAPMREEAASGELGLAAARDSADALAKARDATLGEPRSAPAPTVADEVEVLQEIGYAGEEQVDRGSLVAGLEAGDVGERAKKLEQGTGYIERKRDEYARWQAEHRVSETTWTDVVELPTQEEWVSRQLGPGDTVPPQASAEASGRFGLDASAGVPVAGGQLLHFEPVPQLGLEVKDSIVDGRVAGLTTMTVEQQAPGSNVMLVQDFDVEPSAGTSLRAGLGRRAESPEFSAASNEPSGAPGPATPGAGGPASAPAAPGTPMPRGPLPAEAGPSTRSGEKEARTYDDASESADDFFLGHGEKRQADARRQLTPAELDLLASRRVDEVLSSCRRRPGERPGAMYFRFWGDNPFVFAELDPLSTFGVDVDTASYTLARRYLADGFLPEKAQVRTEEFVNYFEPDVTAPLEDTFAVQADLAPSRFGTGRESFHSSGERWMLRVVVRGKEVSREERQPLALTFVVDASGSMKEQNRLELVKHSLRLLSNELDARDSIAIVAFSNDARVVLPMTSAANRGVIEAALFGLQPDGGTNAEAGLKLGYELALASLGQGAQSRVVLLSDGVANIGQTDQTRLSEDVRRHREAGIFLNTVGVGMGNHNDALLEQLADRGDGLCNYVDGPLEAKRALVDNFTGAFVPIARDVKIQVEFDPTRVHRYRQLGYENRAIADQDFRNDAVDAGEVGSGHQVTALYELELAAPPKADDAPLATVRLRFKPPTGAGRDPLEDAATERAFPVAANGASSWEGSSAGYKRAVVVAQFAEILRRSTHAQDDSLDELLAEAAKLERELGDPDFRELVAMIEKTMRLVAELRPPYDPLARCVDSLRRNCILRAELEELRFYDGARVIDDLELQNRELEARIRDLMRQQLGSEAR